MNLCRIRKILKLNSDNNAKKVKIWIEMTIGD